MGGGGDLYATIQQQKWILSPDKDISLFQKK